jgi:hypothetical protein
VEWLARMISKQILLLQNLKRKCEMIDVVTHDRMKSITLQTLSEIHTRL